jgi:hypothetical protein
VRSSLFVVFKAITTPHLTALNVQWEMATPRAAQQGYRNIARIMLPDAPHDPFPDGVFNGDGYANE